MEKATQKRLTLALPYQERAATAILDAGIRNRAVDAVYRQAKIHAASAFMTKRTDEESERETAESAINGYIDGARRIVGKIPNRAINLRSMHLSKVGFDNILAKRIGTPDVVLGFPGASLQTFEKLPHTSRSIFHAVDAHPVTHNQCLTEAYGARRARAELYPNWLVDRIRRELDAATIVLVPSRLVADQMIKNSIDTKKIVIEPYGVEFERFSPRPREATRDSGRPCLVYVGQMSLRKGIPLLLEAASNVDADFLLVGRVFDKKVIAKLPRNVRHQPVVGHAELARIYSQADAFVLPTIEDACSLVAIEAAAAGLPVITTVNNGAAEILPTGSVVALPVDEVDRLVDALNQVPMLNQKSRIANATAVRDGNGVRDWSQYGVDVLTSAAGIEFDK